LGLDGVWDPRGIYILGGEDIAKEDLLNILGLDFGDTLNSSWLLSLLVDGRPERLGNGFASTLDGMRSQLDGAEAG